MLKAFRNQILLIIFVPLFLVGCVADKGASKSANCGAGQVFDAVTRKCVASAQGGTAVQTNVPPVANLTAGTITEDTAGQAISLTYTDVDGNIATACSVSNLSADLNLTSACTCAGGFCYAFFAGDPDNAYPQNFDYTVTDVNGISNTQTVAVTITNVNDAPTFGSTVYNPAAGAEDIVQNLTLNAASDTDCNALLNVIPNANCPTTMAYSIVSYSRPSNPWTVGLEPVFLGNLLRNCMGANGSALNDLTCDFHPESNFFGTYQFVYRANDGWANSTNDVTVTVTVTSVNDPPVVTCSQCTITVPEDGLNAAPQVPSTLIPGNVLSFEVTNSGAVAGVTGITHTFSDVEDTAGANNIAAYTSCSIPASAVTIGVVSVGSTGLGSCVIDWDMTGFADQNGSAGSFTLSFQDSLGGANSITVNLNVAARNDNPTSVTTFTRYNGLAHVGTAFTESPTAFATGATYYPYLFTVDPSTTVDPTPASPSETLTYTLTTTSWVLNGVAGGPVAIGDVSVPFTVTGCMAGTSTLNCSMSFKGDDGNVHGTITLNFTVSDGNGGSTTDSLVLTVVPVMDSPTACQYSRFTDAKECTLSGCTGTSSPLGVLTPASHTASKPVVWYDSSKATCWASNGTTINSWAPVASGIFNQTINEKDILYIRRLIIDEGGTDVVEDGLDLQITNLQSSNRILIRPENVLFSYDGTTGNEGRADLAAYNWQAATADSGDDYTGYIKITPTGTVSGTSTITFDIVTSPAGATTSVSFNVTVNPVSIQHNDWKVITAAGPTINKYGEVKSVSNVCSYSRDQCNGSACTGVAAPTVATNGGALGAIYYATGTSQCYHHDGTNWFPFTTVCPVTPTAFESNCSGDGASCIGNATPANSSGLGHFYYDMDDDQCYVSTGPATWTAFNAPGSATIGWENFTLSGVGSISGYWVYRRVAGEEYDYDFPINKVIVPLGTTSYVDNATNSWEPPAPNVAYYYEVRPVVNTIPTKPVESYAQARLIVPNDNGAFMSRRMANKLMCAKMFSPSDKTNNNRCVYVGPGDSDPDNVTHNSAYYDIGGDYLVDRFEVGCAYSQGVCNTTDGNCVGDLNPVTNITAALGSVYYSRSDGRCYVNTDGASAWSQFNVATDITATFLSEYSKSELPPLVHINRADAVTFCSDPGNDFPSVVGSTAVFQKSLPTRKEQMAYTQWDTQAKTDSAISSLETGLSLNTTPKCNSSNASGLTGYSDTETPDSSSAYSLPGTNSSGIRSVATGSNVTSECQSFASVQDAVGNVAEWVNVQISSANQNEVQRLAFSGVPGAGDFELTFEGETTVPILFSDNAAAVEAALEGLTVIDDVTVVGSFAAGFDITFGGLNANLNVATLVEASNTLGVTMTISTTTNGSSANDLTFSGAEFSTTVTSSILAAPQAYEVSVGVFDGSLITWALGASVSPIGPCNDTDADDSCDGQLGEWTIENRFNDAGRFFIPMGLPVHRDYDDNVGDPINVAVYPAGHPQAGTQVGTITSWAKVIGQTSGITSTQLHGDSVDYNMSNIAGTTAGMAVGGGYTDGAGGGLYRFELRQDGYTAVDIGLRCVSRVDDTLYSP